MKKILMVVTSVVALSLSSYAQGTFSMVWYDAAQGISIGAAHNQGTAGWFLGSEYSAAAYLAGSLTPLAGSTLAFDINGPTSATGTVANGSGQFYGPTIVTALAVGPTTIQIRAWYNGGQYATYAEALAAGANVGESLVYPIGLTAPTDPTVKSLTDIGMAPFTVGVVPEPSTIALAGLGAASLLMFRRRK